MEANTVGADWLRCPSDSFDPLQSDLWITAKTLVKTLVSLSMYTSVIAAGGYGRLYFGIIAWDGNDPASPTLSGIPDVTNGAYDWICWLSLTASNRSVLTQSFQNNSFNAGPGGLLEYSSQRKLPPGKGVLVTAAWETSGSADCHCNYGVRMGLKGDVTAVGLGGS